MALETKLFILAGLIFCSALFSGVETAIISLNRIRIKHLIEKKAKNAQILADLKEHSHDTISTLLIGNNIVNIGASALATSIAIDLWGKNGVGIATGIMTFLILVFAEITPKTIANNRPEQIATFFAKGLSLLSKLLTPIRKTLDIFVRLITKSFGSKIESTTITEEELKSIVNISEEEGSIKPIEKTMIHNIFRFNDIEVEDVLIPRKDVIMFKASSKLKDNYNEIVKSGNSRFPVWEDRMDNIVGIAYLKDMIKLIQTKKNPTMKSFSKKPFFVPESKKIDELLREFQHRKVHIAIVIDEYGTFSGLVTIEDLLEEIVGDIYDEQDKIIKNIRGVGKNTTIVRGDTAIKEINHVLKLKIKYGPHESISAFLLDKMGKIPKVNDVYESNIAKYIIKELDNNRIIKIKLIKKK